jgi:hypothetical protein
MVYIINTYMTTHLIKDDKLDLAAGLAKCHELLGKMQETAFFVGAFQELVVADKTDFTSFEEMEL